eukprot:TRINITY_DN10727_c0_g1_i1.p3 TRINITY_DN10727_c0_g1~~TRINITY_DN10727_c0_g1_i1.p3  ORF type:complete len:129 (-),score=23.66 TRINITY_DN10727_c0_g1_i1:500-886(-)
MGKFTDAGLEALFMDKIRILFAELREKLNKEHPTAPLTWEDFVLALDCDDKSTKKLFESLVKDTVTTFPSEPPPLAPGSERSTAHSLRPSLILAGSLAALLGGDSAGLFLPSSALRSQLASLGSSEPS